MPADQVAIEVASLHKTFRVPRHRVHTLKERALHPLRRTTFDEFHVLRGIDFEVLRGEFFGIVGRNGSGKSTLLKCLAGIYGVDSGSIRIAGRLSPFIELGVGFNPDLTALDNVVINAVMMGMSPRDARARFEDVLAFAELERFVDMKLKNYSSGMQVRLAFAVMVQSDADVMLIDEVLAVGDAAFQQKCIDVFYRLRAEGKTIVLVTHEMALVERFCHRALMLSGGNITHIGNPAEVGREYMRENFRGAAGDTPTRGGAGPLRLVDAWITDGEGRRVDAVAFHDTMKIHVQVEALDAVQDPGMAIWVTTDGGTRVFTAGAREEGERLGDFEAGERIEFAVETTNVLSAGRYHVGCAVVRGSAGLEVLMSHQQAAELMSYGADLHGVIGISHVPSVTRTRAAEAVR
jgi:ABC-type polysaccharide/polyol phosphate transport system ATPase subunit